MKVGELVRTTQYARAQLGGARLGMGHVVKVVGGHSQIAYVLWNVKGKPAPINVRWLEVVE